MAASFSRCWLGPGSRVFEPGESRLWATSGSLGSEPRRANSEVAPENRPFHPIGIGT